MELEANNVYTEINQQSEGYFGTYMVAQATDWDLHNSHGFINTHDEDYSFDPYVFINQYHGNDH